MPNTYFRFKQFTIQQDRCAMKVTTDACVFGAWVAEEMLYSDSEKMLDIGAGTGLLSLMIAQKNKARIDAVEIDKEAAEQAKENVSASVWKDQIQVLHENILQLDHQKKYDVIFTNPPFYENELRSGRHTKDTAHHSSELTMAEVTGFIKNHLKEDGVFFLLLPAKREEEIEKLLQKNELFISKKISLKQTPRHLPFRYMIMGSSTKPIAPVSSVIIIKDEEDHYTTEFISLLKDYYLYL